MTNEDIILSRTDVLRMAREVGFEDSYDLGYYYKPLKHFAALVASLVAAAASASEREACAKLADEWPRGHDDVYLLADAIRARGETTLRGQA